MPASAVATAGLFQVTVFNPAPGGGTSNALTFTMIPTFTLTVNRTGDGTGSVSSSPPGIACAIDCTEAYPSGTAVTLTTTPDATSYFVGFSGGCVSATTSCTLTMTGDSTVTATFSPLILTAINVTPPNPTLIVGETQPFTAIGEFNDGSTRPLTMDEVTWSSSNTAVAPVDTTGLAEGISAGTTAITATATGEAAATAQFSLISGGSYHTCALLSDGTAKCWGANYSGQVGNGTTSFSATPTPVSVSDLSTATALAAGSNHTCALLSDGTVKCWGYNGYGQLGDGTTTDSSTPVPVIGIANAVALAAGGAHTCAVLSDGMAKCWGSNNSGQLGNGTTSFGPTSTPVAVSGIATAIAIASGGTHTCALLSEGTVKCWGYNGYGQLGDGTTTDSSTPVMVSDLSTATAISTKLDHTCAVLSDGAVKCWGDNFFYQLGDATLEYSSIPVAVIGLSTAIAVATGDSHTCVLLSDGAVKCWGFNDDGQLGDGTTTLSSTPVSVFGLPTAATITAGANHTCALLSNGTAYCWGFNRFYGALGNGTTTNSSTPVPVIGSAPPDALHGSTTLTVNNPVPSIITLSPSSAVAETISFVLTVEGSGFVQGASVLFDGTPLITTYVSDAQLMAEVPASAIATAGIFQVAIFNPTPGGGTSNLVAFSVTENPITLSITSPLSGSFVNQATVMVQGTVTSGTGEVGVVVNDVLAQVNGNQFVANDVPLMLGENILTATATDFEGTNLTRSVTVTANELLNPVDLLANPVSGVASLAVEFSIRPNVNAAILSHTLDADGDGTVDLTDTVIPETILFTYTEPGLYLATITLTDDQGNLYTDTLAINVLSLVKLDALLQSKWDGMKAALTDKNTEGALRFFADSSKEMYRQNFTLMNAILPQIASDMGEIQFIKSVEQGAVYTMNAAQEGRTYSFYIEFVIDTDGLWKIRFF